MALRVVVLEVSGNAKERELLEEDLHRISCHGLLEKPWNVQREEIMVELMGEKDNRWDGTVRQALERWTTVEWRKVYGFPRQGEGMASRMDRFIDDKFSTHLNS